MSTPTFRISQALTRLGKVFGKALDEDLVDAYVDVLGREPLDLLEQACEEAARTEQFFPRPKTLLRIMDALERRQARPTVTVPEVREVNGRTERLYRCAECEDTGFVPVRQNGFVLMWQDVRTGVEKHHAVRKCACGTLRRSGSQRDRGSYEEPAA